MITISRLVDGLAGFVRREPLTAGGYLIIFAVSLAAVFAPLVAPFDPEAADTSAILVPPSAEHWLGTDSTGMDVFSRLLHAPRIDLGVAVAGVALSFLVGTPLGMLTGYFEGLGAKGALAELILRLADMVQSFPVFVLAMALVVFAGQRISNVILAIAFVNAPVFLRLVRSGTLSVRKMAYVEAARVAQLPSTYILGRHVLPNAIAPGIVQISGSIGWAILLTAGLSFIGAGVQIPTPELGVMVAQGSSDIITGQWWPSLFPGLMITVIVTSFALVGRHAQTLLDPRQRRRPSAVGFELPSLGTVGRR